MKNIAIVVLSGLCALLAFFLNLEVDKNTYLNEQRWINWEESVRLSGILNTFTDFEDCAWHVTELTTKDKKIYILGVLVETDEYFKDVEEVKIITKKRNLGYLD